MRTTQPNIREFQQLGNRRRAVCRWLRLAQIPNIVGQSVVRGEHFPNLARQKPRHKDIVARILDSLPDGSRSHYGYLNAGGGGGSRRIDPVCHMPE